ncbi:hypothetical protein BPOR_0400g00100 [Botrytis porri]|uniref:Enoyl-CoA hydratase n=1 Tax=Botrytis porri TaxID=87229 RepID=A0A4Z1KH42_9HELO|nr:hypothetical protein BPOR_0400g00100 [Botrytis porri]
MASSKPTYKHFLVTYPAPYIAHVQINRPEKLNAFFEAMWLEFRTIFDTLSYSPDVRSIILSGAGERAFSAGLDVEAAAQDGVLAEKEGKTTDVARTAQAIKRHVEEFQACITVICVLHGYSLGLSIDISTCADIRICTSDVKMAVKEVDIGLAADIGTLSRLPKVVGSFSWVKDVCLSARVFGAEEALRVGFVTYVEPSKQKAIEKALGIAKLLAEKSPVAVQGTKELLNHARDNRLADSLRYTGVWNSAAIQTKDVKDAMLSGLQKRKPTFEKL